MMPRALDGGSPGVSDGEEEENAALGKSGWNDATRFGTPSRGEMRGLEEFDASPR
jgi:hypothetical protein